MSRVVQKVGQRGSLKWIQRAVNRAPRVLSEPLGEFVATAASTVWLSPIANDDYAEYRDRDFLDLVGVGELSGRLSEYWPQRGPQWDALGRTSAGDILLVEAKAHIAELCSPASSAGPRSRMVIEKALAQTIEYLGARPRAPWVDVFYQLANRLTHLHFLRREGCKAWLVLANFVGDRDIGGPETKAEWEAAYKVVHHIMGLSERHALSRYVVHIYPHVSDLDI